MFPTVYPLSQAPAKRSQHANSTYRNIVGRNMLRAFGHPVATCCDVLGVVGPNLTIFKLEPTTPNMSQHIATGWPNARNMMRPTMLRYVALTCCDRLAGASERTLSCKVCYVLRHAHVFHSLITSKHLCLFLSTCDQYSSFLYSLSF